MIEIMDIVSGIQTVLTRVGMINTEVDLRSKTTYTVNLTSEVIPILDEVSQIDLEEV